MTKQDLTWPWSSSSHGEFVDTSADSRWMGRSGRTAGKERFEGRREGRREKLSVDVNVLHESHLAVFLSSRCGCIHCVAILSAGDCAIART